MHKAMGTWMRPKRTGQEADLSASASSGRHPPRRNPASQSPSAANAIPGPATSSRRLSSPPARSPSQCSSEANRIPGPAISFRPPSPLSPISSPAVPNSAWCSYNFMLGAGMVILQPSTSKIVVLHDAEANYWFLPKGRKDVGESLEATALREAYEESGYQVEFLPLYTPTHAPNPPDNTGARSQPNVEPIFTTLTSWNPARRRYRMGGEYITLWYVGQIPEDAVHIEGTGMPNEQGYTSHICTYEEACQLLSDTERTIVRYAWLLFEHFIEHEASLRSQPST